MFAGSEHIFPTQGHGLELACGAGRSSVWLASRGLTVLGVDRDPGSITHARRTAAAYGVADRCRFELHDLDLGLPADEPADVIICHLFRDPSLDHQILDRLKPGGLLAIATLSEVGFGPGRFRAKPGELSQCFSQLHPILSGEGSGRAWLAGYKPHS